MDVTIIYIIIFLLLAVVLIFISCGVYKEKISQLHRSEEIQIGMTEKEMLAIMGDGYTRSLLKNNRKKYEWRINGSSYGSSRNGFSTRTYTGVKKVSIYVKNGLVEEVRGFNLK